MTRKQLILIALVILFLVIFAFAVRIFILKQSDGDYESLSQAISKAKDAKDATSRSVASIASPIFITDEFSSAYPKLVSELSKAIDSVDKSPVLAKDVKLKETHDKYKATLESYVTSNKNLASSVKFYFAVADACSTMGYNLDSIRSKGGAMTLSTFNTNAKDCQDAITAGATSPDQPFNDQFFDAYLDNSTSLVAAYRQEFSAQGNQSTPKSSRLAIEKKWDEILGMNNATLDLKRSPDPSEALTKLDEVITKQKSNFFR